MGSIDLNGACKPDGLAVITGASGGIGSAVAWELLRWGWRDFVVSDIADEPIGALAASLREQGARVAVCAGDISDPGFPAALIASLDGRKIKAIVHAAGISPTMGSPEKIIEVNLMATIRLLDGIRGRIAPEGVAVLIASNSAHFEFPAEVAAAFASPPAAGSAALARFAPSPMIAYPLSKYGVIQLMKREAPAFGKQGARIVSVSPGATDTPMVRLEMANSSATETVLANAAIPRLARPDEIASVAAFLCSSFASFVTAADFLVDGGEVNGMMFNSSLVEETAE